MNFGRSLAANPWLGGKGFFTASLQEPQFASMYFALFMHFFLAQIFMCDCVVVMGNFQKMKVFW